MKNVSVRGCRSAVFPAGMLLLLSLVSVLGGCSSKGKLEREKAALIEGITEGKRLISSGEGTLTYEYVRNDTTNAEMRGPAFWQMKVPGPIHMRRIDYFRKEIACSFDSTAWRFDETLADGTFPVRESVSVKKNGEIKRLTTRIDSLGVSRQVAFLFFYNLNEDYDTDNLAEIVMKSPYSFATYPLETVLAGGISRLEYLTVASIEDEALDGVPCKKIHFTDKNQTGGYADLWVAPQWNCMVVREELVSPDKRDDHRMDYREIGGVRFLKTYVWTSFNRREGKETLSSTTTAALSDDWRFNEAIPADRFELTFPDSVEIILGRQNGAFVPKKNRVKLENPIK